MCIIILLEWEYIYSSTCYYIDGNEIRLLLYQCQFESKRNTLY